MRMASRRLPRSASHADRVQSEISSVDLPLNMTVHLSERVRDDGRDT